MRLARLGEIRRSPGFVTTKLVKNPTYTRGLGFPLGIISWIETLDSSNRVARIFVGSGLLDIMTRIQYNPKEAKRRVLNHFLQPCAEPLNDKKAIIVRRKYIDSSMKSVSAIPV